MNDLLHELIAAGLIQFGLFDGKPLVFNLKLLPSYPRILAHVADTAAQMIDASTSTYEYLICTRDALPFGVVLSQQTGIPLVYANPEEQGVMSLAGAYDVGHRSLLLANTWLETEDIEWVLARARRVGLEIDKFILIVGADISWGDVEAVSLLDMVNVINQLMDENAIPEGQANAVKRWLAQVTV